VMHWNGGENPGYQLLLSNSNITDNSTSWRCSYYIPPNIPNKHEPALFGKPSLQQTKQQILKPHVRQS
jgi:hypothetical protein